MKKLLLLSLLTISATSFAAVKGTETDVALPIKATATVVADSDKSLIITPTTNGMNGTSMQFDFGSIAVTGTSAPIDGSFEVTTANASAFEPSKIKVGFDTNGKATDETSADSGNVKFKYSTSGVLEDANKKYVGNVRVIVETNSATPSEYVDGSKKIFVKVTA